MGPAADFAALGTQAECILQRGEQAQAADRPRAWEGPAGQARDDQEEGGRARGAEADQGVWMTARSACSRGPRGALHVHPFRVDLNTHTREHTVHAFVYYRTSTCSIYRETDVSSCPPCFSYIISQFTPIMRSCPNPLPLCGACPFVGYCGSLFSINYFRKNKKYICGYKPTTPLDHTTFETELRVYVYP